MDKGLVSIPKQQHDLLGRYIDLTWNDKHITKHWPCWQSSAHARAARLFVISLGLTEKQPYLRIPKRALAGPAVGVVQKHQWRCPKNQRTLSLEPTVQLDAGMFACLPVANFPWAQETRTRDWSLRAS